MKNSRRQFMVLSAAGAAALALNRGAQAQALTPLLPTDPTAVALGYVSDHLKVNKAKFANYVTGSRCDGCMLYQGAPKSSSGPCQIMPGKLVDSNGWCSAFQKKA